MFNNRTHTSAFLLAVLFALLPALQGTSQDLSFLSDSAHYQWPTDASTYISSTFGETRSAHFHAGLDIRTRGREGYRVFATRDGIVSRLSISPHGYGKVIFLKHDDGSCSIYAHLNRFEESLMTLADSIRMQDYSFVMDKNFEQDSIRVSQGELIGYTGSTGVGPPHLHFELCTPDHKPFNPLLTNLGVVDRIPPVFSGLAVEHLNSRTMEVVDLETRRATRQGNDYHLGTITAGGPVGLSVNVHDRANRTPNVYAVYELMLVHEQDTLFHSRVDTYSYNKASQMFIDRVFSLLREQRRGYQRLFLVNGNELPFYKTGKTRGVVDLPEGDHELEIIAKDFYGNTSIARLNLKVTGRDSPVAEKITSIPAYPQNGINTAGNKAVQYSPLPRRPLPPAPPLYADQSTGSSGPNPETEWIQPPVAASQTSLLSYTKESEVKRIGKKLVPGKRQFLHMPDKSIWLEFPEDALFDTLHVEMLVTDHETLPVIRFQPGNIPLNNSARLNIILKNPPEKNPPEKIRPVGIFAFNRQGNRQRLLGAGVPGSIIRTTISELQELHLLYDNTSPWVGSPRIEENLAGMQVVHVPVADRTSGIDYRRSTIQVNGEKGITEYDPDKEKLTFYKPGFEPLDENNIEVRVYDRLGNFTHRVFTR